MGKQVHLYVATISNGKTQRDNRIVTNNPKMALGGALKVKLSFIFCFNSRQFINGRIAFTWFIKFTFIFFTITIKLCSLACELFH